MRKLLVLCLCVSTLLSAAVYADTVVGLVNMQVALASTDEGKNAKESLQKLYKKLQAELDVVKKKLETMSKAAALLKPQERAKKEQEFQALYKQFNEKQRAAQKTILEKEKSLQSPIVQRKRELINEIAILEKVDMVLEDTMAPVYYIKIKKNLTQKLIDLYNKRYPFTAKGSSGKKSSGKKSKKRR